MKDKQLGLGTASADCQVKQQVKSVQLGLGTISAEREAKQQVKQVKDQQLGQRTDPAER